MLLLLASSLYLENPGTDYNPSELDAMQIQMKKMILDSERLQWVMYICYRGVTCRDIQVTSE